MPVRRIARVLSFALCPLAATIAQPACTSTTAEDPCLHGPPPTIACGGHSEGGTWDDAVRECNENGGRLYETPCGGYLAELEVIGGDQQLRLYDATTKKFVAELNGTNKNESWICTRSASPVVIDTRACWKPNSVGDCWFGFKAETDCDLPIRDAGVAPP